MKISDIIKHTKINARYIQKLASFYASKSNVPEYLYVELTNICTANCIFCAHQHDPRERTVIEKNFFQKAVDEYVLLGGKNISFTPPGGEPFVDPFILDKLEYVRDRGFHKVHFFTNMSLFHKFDAKRFLKSGIVSLHISTAPFEEIIYKSIYRTDIYSDVLRNISHLLQMYNNESEKTLKNISIEFRADRTLGECITCEDFINHIRPYLNESITVNASSVYDSWNGSIQKGDLLEGMAIKDYEFFKFIPCSRLLNVQIMVNGDIRLCGCRYNPSCINDELVIGNIRTETIHEAYNSPNVKIILNSFIRNDMPAVCRKCSWYEIYS